MARTGKYGRQHRALRTELIREAYGRPCHFCHQPMRPGQPLDLDHTLDGRSYRGITHRRCNRSDGGRRGAEKTNGRRRRTADPGPSREW